VSFKAELAGPTFEELFFRDRQPFAAGPVLTAKTVLFFNLLALY
jgi:hypothetical protein